MNLPEPFQSYEEWLAAVDAVFVRLSEIHEGLMAFDGTEESIEEDKRLRREQRELLFEAERLTVKEEFRGGFEDCFVDFD